ncbi:uncharacterized protein LOC107195621 isoform X2 [Pteropus alecto]|uniref:uncharacterized protein LOC107195621 isoform X2 n=1 Tax=Pteropus alecto TaxID=9402 RepID=UPI000D533694|nr:uncharacterized protein LOC107195621 isoform X2 [Pteropus alecto]
MRGQQAGSWAMFHSQNQDPPRSTSCLASQAPSPVASPLRWQGTVWCLSQGARRPGPRRGSRLPTRWAHFSLWSPPPRLAWIQGGRKRRNRCPAGHQLLNPATRPLPGRCLTVCREPRQAGQCHLVFTRCRSWSPSVLVTSAPGQTPEGEKNNGDCCSVLLRSRLRGVGGGGRCWMPSWNLKSVAHSGPLRTGHCAGFSNRRSRFKQPGGHRLPCAVERSRGLFTALLTLRPWLLQAPTCTHESTCHVPSSPSFPSVWAGSQAARRALGKEELAPAPRWAGEGCCGRRRLLSWPLAGSRLSHPESPQSLPTTHSFIHTVSHP